MTAAGEEQAAGEGKNSYTDCQNVILESLEY